MDLKALQKEAHAIAKEQGLVGRGAHLRRPDRAGALRAERGAGGVSG